MKKIVLFLMSLSFIFAMPSIVGSWSIVFNSNDLKVLKYPSENYLNTLAKKIKLDRLIFKNRELNFYKRVEFNSKTQDKIDYSNITKNILNDLEKSGYIKIAKNVKKLILKKISGGNVTLFYRANSCPKIPSVVEEFNKSGYLSVQNNCKVELDRRLCPILQCFK